MNPITESNIETFAIEHLEKFRDTLLPKLMSGELRVKLEEEEAGI